MARESASPWARIEQRPDGVFLTVRPGAPADELALLISELLERRIPRVDFEAVQSAWHTAAGVAVRIAPPADAPAEPTLSLDPFLRTEEREGEVFLRISPETPRFSERALIAWLNRRDYSGLDLELVRIAHMGPRGVRFQITQAGSRASGPELAEARTILVADADEATRNRLVDALERRGLTVRAAKHAEMAIFEVRQRPIDLVLLAHPFGREDGLRFCQQVRAEPRASGIAVVAVCAQPTREVVRRALDCGVSDILVRPWPPGALFAKMEGALRRAGKRLVLTAAPGVAKDAELQVPGEEMKTLGRIDVSKLCGAVAKLHALPGVVERVLELTSDPETGAKELATCIESDPAVAAIVLRMANSALYGASGRVASVAESIMRIGFRQTKSLVVGMSVIRTFTKGMKTAGFDRVLFWRHSIGAAILSRLLAEHGKVPGPEVAFVAGLLHDVGKLFLDEFVPMDFSLAVMSAIQGRVPLVSTESKLLQTTHAEVGQAVLSAWKFPESVVTAVERHHAVVPDEEGMEPGLRRICDIVHAANVLSKATGHGHGGDLCIAEVPDPLWLRLHLRPGLPEGFWEKYRAERERFEQLLGLEIEAAPEAGAAPPVVMLCDSHLPCVSVLATALESAGWRVVFGRSPSDAPDALAAVVLRSASADELVAAARPWAATLPALRLIAVLPKGASVPHGYPSIVESYDRSALLDLLPPVPRAPEGAAKTR